MNLDASLVSAAGQMPKFNNPFEQLGRIREQQMQEENAAAIREQREAMAEQRRMQNDAAARGLAEETQLNALFGRPGASPKPHEIFSIVGPVRGTAIVQGLNALKTQEIKDEKELRGVIGSVLGGIKALPEGLRAGVYDSTLKGFAEKGWIDPAQVQPYSPEVLDAYQQWSMTGEQQVSTAATAARDAQTAKHQSAVLDETKTHHRTTENLTAAELRERQRHNRNTEANAARTASGGGERVWVTRNGQALYVPKLAVQAGDVPYAAGQQGRALPAGDASSVADFDTALDDVRVLRGVIAPKDAKGNPTQTGVTGNAAWLRSRVPDFVTDRTGFGGPEKSRQATIDRVKQVIGKTLEGGVLRKEDEYKYTKILPTIADSPTVAAAKLDGLEKALVQRKQRSLDAYADAGFDTSKFAARGASSQPPQGAPAAAPRQEFVVTTPDGQTFKFDSKAKADVFKKRAGL